MADLSSSFVITRRVFFRALGWIYLFSFASIWHQYPGLFGHNGLLPVDAYMERTNTDFDPSFDGVMKKLRTQPTLLHFAPVLNIHPDILAEALLLLGMVISALAAVSLPPMALTYAVLFVLYLSIYSVGQTFLSFQWDILLLEVGFMAILWAPLFPALGKPQISATKWNNYNSVAHWGVRVIFFKLMFMSGVVKIQADCPAWLSLEALASHFATQCIPTPLAWYAHQLPGTFLHWGVAGTFIIEIPMTFLILSPEAQTRRVGAIAQLLLQFSIMLTGNYNFFNILTCTLAFALIDDGIWTRWWPWRHLQPQSEDASVKDSSSVAGVAKAAAFKVVTFALTILVASDTIDMLEVNRETWDVRLLWGTQHIQEYVTRRVPQALAVIAAGMLLSALLDCYVASVEQRSLARALTSAARALVVGSVLVASVVPLIALERNLFQQQPIALVSEDMLAMYRVYSSWSVVAGYGLFRRMTGVTDSLQVARPEVDIQLLVPASQADKAPEWISVPFQHKPGDLTKAPRFIAPHQPRLDWQMWFAALGSYRQSPWLVHLCKKLLLGEPDVLALLDLDQSSSEWREPLKVRARLLKYDFTRWSPASWPPNARADVPEKAFLRDENDTRWWWAWDEVGEEYLPELEVNNSSVDEFLKAHGWDQKDGIRPVADCMDDLNEGRLSRATEMVCRVVKITRDYSSNFAFSFVFSYAVLAMVNVYASNS